MTYKEQLADPRWQKKRLQILERDNWTCQVCLDNATQLHIHHLYYHNDYKVKAWEYKDDAYKTLCKDCHLIEEFIKKEGQKAVIATKKYLPEHDCVIISTIVTDVDNGLTLSIFTINNKRKLKFIINFKDTSVYSMKDLLENAKKLL